jgi:hypothetical protein
MVRVRKADADGVRPLADVGPPIKPAAFNGTTSRAKARREGGVAERSPSGKKGKTMSILNELKPGTRLETEAFGGHTVQAVLKNAPLLVVYALPAAATTDPDAKAREK